MDLHYLFMFRIEDCKNLNTIIQKNENHQTPLIIVLRCGCYVYILFLCKRLVYIQYILFVHKLQITFKIKDTRSHSRLSIIYNHNNNKYNADDNDDDGKHFKN